MPRTTLPLRRIDRLRSRWCRIATAALVPIGAIALLVTVHAQNDKPHNDAIARLDRQIESGAVTLEYREGFGYLPSLLQHLDVSADSQVLVFSKTSFQQALIGPQNPRALYFGDGVSVGTVPGGDFYELVVLEPNDGLAFYTLPARQTERPRFKRRGVECLFCHSPGNKGAPALVVASVIPSADGTPAYTGSFISTIDHRTPFEDRWGGWYVTGTHGSQTHLGNAVAPDPDRPFDLQQVGTQNLTSLRDKLDVSKYLTPSSDIVGLMTLEHQVGVVNRINAITFQYRRAERAGEITDTQWKRFDTEVDDLAGYLLFVDEARLREPIAGTSAFARTFAARGPRDTRGRSLRDFDLERRLFRYSMSYMIYSDAFDGMPTAIRERLYRRLYDALTGAATGKKYAILAEADRQAVLEILLDTKTNLPAYWIATPADTPVGTP